MALHPAAQVPAPSGGALPRHELTAHQADLYIADQAADHSAAYHAAVIYRVTGSLDGRALRRRFVQLLADHPMLASRVVEGDNGWYFEPADIAPELHVVTVPVAPDGDRARRRVRNECLRPLDPMRGPLIRAVLLRYSDEVADLIVAAHHLVVDEQSFSVLIRRLVAGEEHTPRETYAEWAERTRTVLPARLDRASAIRAELGRSDLAPSLDWADDTSEAAGSGGGTAELRVPAGVWSEVRRHCAELQVTPYAFALAAAGLVLGRNARVPRPVLGATVSRRLPRHAATIGYFNSTVLIPVDLDGASTVAEHLRRVHDRSMQAYRDADLPLSTVLPESAAGAPRLVVVPSSPAPEVTTSSARCTPRDDIDLGAAQFPLALYLRQCPDGSHHGVLRFQREVVTESAAERFCRQLEWVIACFADDPTVSLSDVNTVPAADMRRLSAADAPALPVSRGSGGIPGRFGVWVGLQPDAVAVDGLSYREVGARSDRLA
ncbi:condensation domain-containing protein, partial [Streptomyces chattanoogensis]